MKGKNKKWEQQTKTEVEISKMRGR